MPANKLNTENRCEHDPTAGTILDGILRHHITLNYARWRWYTASNADRAAARPGPFLKLAYWIGPSPGQTPIEAEEDDNQLNRYRDNTPGRQGRDRWVVMVSWPALTSNSTS